MKEILDIGYVKTGDELSSFVDNNEYKDVLDRYEASLNKNHTMVIEDLQQIKSAVDLLNSYNVTIDGETLQLCLSELKNIKSCVEKCIIEFMGALCEKQKKCEHSLYEIARDSHHTFYRCDKCGYEQRV